MPNAKKEVDAEGLEEDEIKLHLLQGGAKEVVDFKVKRASIKKVEYFEDMLLEECDRLVALHDYSRAFECCLRVETRNPGWKGLSDHVNGVLFAEGRKALIDGDGERGLRLLRELLGRKRDYPGLLDEIGEAYGKRIEKAISLGLFPRGRRVLHELEQVVPEHILVKQMRALFVKRATERVQASESLPAPARLDALVEAPADLADPRGNRAASIHKAFREEPTLEVAVNDVAAPLGPWVRTPADQRVSRLLYRPILESDDEDARHGKKPGQLAAGIESSDLGRRMVLKIRSGFHWSDGSRPVSAIDVGRDLIDRTDPHSLRFDARWADLLDRVEVADETRLEIRLNHSPLKGGAWLMGPVGPAHAGFDGRVTSTGRDRPLVTDSLFGCVLAGTDRVELRLRDDLKPAEILAATAPADQPAAAPLAGVMASQKTPADGRPGRLGPAGSGTRKGRHQANSRNPPAQRPIGRKRTQTRRRELDRARPARPGHGAGRVARDQGWPVLQSGHPFPGPGRPQPGPAQPVAAARAVLRHRPQGPSRGLRAQADGRSSGRSQRRAFSQGQLRRRA